MGNKFAANRRTDISHIGYDSVRAHDDDDGDECALSSLVPDSTQELGRSARAPLLKQMPTANKLNLRGLGHPRH